MCFLKQCFVFGFSQNINVLTSTELEETMIQNLADAMNNVASVVVETVG